MSRAHGKNARVFVSQSSATAASPISNLSKYALNRATDVVETTAFGDTNKTYVQGLPDLKGSISGFWDSASDPLYSAGNSPTGVNMYLYPDFVNTPTAYDYGPAWLNTSLDVAVNGPITISGDFVANGSWGKKP
jgi:hypothetical protein